MIQFTVNLAPVPWGRAVPVPFTLPGGALRVKMVTPDDTRDAERAMRLSAVKYRPRKPLVGALGLDTVHVVKPPQNFPPDRSRDWPHVVPDDDNYRKLIMDSFHGMFWRNDAQVCGGESWKVYGAKPRTFIRIWQLGREDLAHVLGMIGEPMPQMGIFDGGGDGNAG